MNRKCPSCGSRETVQAMRTNGRSGLWQCLARHAEDYRKGLRNASPFFDRDGQVSIRDALDRIYGRPPTKEQTSC